MQSWGMHNSHLPRLAPEEYQGEVYFHWTMTIDQRKTGWLYFLGLATKATSSVWSY